MQTEVTGRIRAALAGVVIVDRLLYRSSIEQRSFFFRLLGWALVCSGLMIKLGVTFRTATGLVVASQCMVKLTDKEGLPDSPVREFLWRAVCAEASGFASVLHGNVVRLLLSSELGCKGPFVGDP